MIGNGTVMNEWKMREQMCEIGRRIYNKGFAAANDGNISYRLAEDRVLCTPTRVSKGFMKPDDLCIVDLDGKQISGKRKRSSEILLHLTIMKARADVRSVRALPSPSRDGVRRGPRADPQVRPARDRGLPGRGGHLALRDAGRPEVRRHGAPLRQGHRDDPPGQPRHASPTAPTWKTPTSRPRSSTPTAGSCSWPSSSAGSITTTTRRPPS